MDFEKNLIAVRIKDGIFVGNVTAAQDEEFLHMNKITHVINCAGTEVPNLFAQNGIKYLRFHWKDANGPVCPTVMFDDADENIRKTVSFIDEALENGDCVLIHSYFGASRSPVLVAAYLIVKYGWKLDSALAFLSMAHQDMDIKPHFMRQLRAFSKKHAVDQDVFDVTVDDSRFALDNDQWMLRNTLLNGLTFDVQKNNELYKLCAGEVEIGISAPRPQSSRKKRIHFIDTNEGTTVSPTGTTPVVEPRTRGYVDPYSGNNGTFLGSHGPVTLRSVRRRDSIVSRSISPCTRQLESSLEVNAKGRQVLDARKSPPTPPNTARLIQGSHAIIASTANNDVSCENGTTVHIMDVRRQNPPVVPRSPYATLASSHQYRNGSPLPASATTHAQRVTVPSKQPRQTSSPRSSLAQGTPKPARARPSASLSYVAPSTISSPRPRSAVGSRSGSPSVTSQSSVRRSNVTTSSAVDRSSGTAFKGIAPQRTTPGSAAPPPSASAATLDSPRTIVLRQSTPTQRSYSALASSPRVRTVSSPRVHTASGTLPGSGNSLVPRNASSGSLLRRQPPTPISSARR